MKLNAMEPVGLQVEGSCTHGDIEIVRDGAQLIIQNARLRRVLDLSHALPRTTSLFDRRGNVEHAASNKIECDLSFMGYNMPTSQFLTEYSLESIEVELVPGSCLDGENVVVRLNILEAVQGLRLVREYFIYPELAVISARCGIASQTVPNLYWTRRGGLWKNEWRQAAFSESCVDSIKVAPSGTGFTVVEFSGRTDYTNDLVQERRVEEADFSVNGSLLLLERADRSGLFVLQEAPPSSERRDFEEHDFRYAASELHSLCWGIAPHEVSQERIQYSYRTTMGLFGPDEAVGGRRLLKQYLKTRFPQDETKDYDVLVNPWGFGNFPSQISEPFLLAEIEAAAEVGATHYQIDDGWHRGKSLAELIQNNRAVEASFWDICPTLFPNGFERLSEVAAQHNIELALWLSPSSNQEFRDWESFVELVYGFYERFGFKRFKIDGVTMRSKVAEENLEKIIRTLRLRSNGDILFNFDVTNGQRAGYFLFLEYGNIFLENRYACHNWGATYHPEQVLRNLWRLASYVRTQVLQIEVTDYLNINRAYYDEKGVGYPDLYTPAYWAAVTLFASPLLWFAPSKLSPELRPVYREVMELHRQYREAIFAGEIFPVGAEPSGKSLTGFQSHSEAGMEGFLVVYRELQAPESGSLDLHFCKDEALVFTSVSDDAEPVQKSVGESGICLTLEEPGSFRLYRYRRDSIG